MEFIEEEEEIDIKFEYETDDLDLDHDLGSSSHSTDWKLNTNVECRVMLERMKSLDYEKELQRDPDDNGVAEPQTSPEQIDTDSVDKSCGVYRKLKLLVDVLKHCEKREKCGLCEKYIQQLQQHLLLNHGNNGGDDHEKNTTLTSLSTSIPMSLIKRSDVPFEMKNFDVKSPHGDVAETLEDELVPALTIASESERESTSRDKYPSMIKRKSTSKGGKSKPYKCDNCPMRFLTFYDLTQHKTTHTAEMGVTGNVSGRILRTSSNSNQHGLLTGNQKQRYSCDVCQKNFRCSSLLIRHKRNHIEMREYECGTCGKRFRLQKNLARHKFLHTGVKPYKCDVCGKWFAHNSHLTEHKRTHTKEKPYKCDLCSKCFANNSHLTRHKLVHTGDKPHKCELCGKCFSLRRTLVTHKITHTGEKHYRCELCGKCFALNGNLLRHILTHRKKNLSFAEVF